MSRAHRGCPAPLPAPRANLPPARGGAGAAGRAPALPEAWAGPAARGRSAVPLAPTSQPQGLEPGSRPTSLHYLGCARTRRRGHSRDFPSITTCLGDRIEERGPRLLRPDRGTWGEDGWSIHLLAPRRRLPQARGPFPLPRLLAPRLPRADSPGAGARSRIAPGHPPRPRAAT